MKFGYARVRTKGPFDGNSVRAQRKEPCLIKILESANEFERAMIIERTQGGKAIVM